MENMCKVIIINGQQLLVAPNGEILPGIIKTVVVDQNDGLPKCVATLYVELQGSTEENTKGNP